MNPKRTKDFYKITAKQLGISEDLVKDAVDMYWKEIRKSLTELKHHAVYVKGLGTFKIKPWKLAEMEEDYTRILSYNDGSTFRKMAMKKDLEDRISKIKAVQIKIAADVNKKQTIKDIRNANIKGNMEEPSSDNRGSSKHDLQEGTGGGDLREEDEDM